MPTITVGDTAISPVGIPPGGIGTPTITGGAHTQTIYPVPIPPGGIGTPTLSQLDFGGATDLRLSNSGDELLIRWTATVAPGTLFQVYLNGALAWWGDETFCLLPWPLEPVNVVVAAVGDNQGQISYSSLLPSLPANRCALTWEGGTFLGAVSFAIYSSTAPGGSVSYTTPVATVPAYAGGITDGYDLCDYDDGGWGEAASTYHWTSRPLASGVWTFGVKSVDAAGNLSTPVTASVTLAGPPNEPAANAAGIRLTYTFDPSTRVATLHWQDSPP